MSFNRFTSTTLAMVLLLSSSMLFTQQPQLQQHSSGIGGCFVAELPPNLENDVSAGNQEWIDGLKAGTAERAVASYSQDAVFCNATGDCVKGPASIAALYKEVIAKFGRATDAYVRSDSLRVDHDLAYESGYAEAHFPNGVARRGRYSTVWKLQSDGHWKIFRNMSLSPFLGT